MRNSLIHILILLISIGTGAAPARSTIPSHGEQLPAEYEKIKRVVNKITKYNDLGIQPLIFTIVPGSYAIVLAKGLGLCDDKSCEYFGQLNPFQRYGKKIDEILRQNYLYGKIEGWAYSTGTVEITHPTFRIYGEREDFLACTVAHELAHVLYNHRFNITKKVSQLSADATKKEKELIDAKVSREYEIMADQVAYDMLRRAGYPEETCIDALDFLHKTSGDGSATSPTDTHPGHSERLSALETYMNESEGSDHKKSNGTEGVWLYKPDMNYLKFSPVSR